MNSLHAKSGRISSAAAFGVHFLRELVESLHMIYQFFTFYA